MGFFYRDGRKVAKIGKNKAIWGGILRKDARLRECLSFQLQGVSPVGFCLPANGFDCLLGVLYNRDMNKTEKGRLPVRNSNLPYVSLALAILLTARYDHSPMWWKFLRECPTMIIRAGVREPKTSYDSMQIALWVGEYITKNRKDEILLV